jgi:hypothetical protein
MALFRQLGIKEYYGIEAPRGLQDLESSITLLEGRIRSLNSAINKPRSHLKTNQSRQSLINQWKLDLAFVKGVIEEEQRDKFYRQFDADLVEVLESV